MAMENHKYFEGFPISVAICKRLSPCKQLLTKRFSHGYCQIYSGNLLQSYWIWPIRNSEFSHKKVVIFHSYVSHYQGVSMIFLPKCWIFYIVFSRFFLTFTRWCRHFPARHAIQGALVQAPLPLLQLELFLW